MTNFRRDTRGMSLIEMLVVMVILAVGILGITNVFPQGFRFLDHSRNVTLASRLTQAEVERWKTYADNVPDGIEAEDPTTGLPWSGYNPDDMSNASPADLPKGESLWYWSNVNRVRMVRGETTKIPTATMLPYGTGGNYAFSLYNLKFAPVAFSLTSQHKLPAGYEWPDQYVLIYGDPLPRKDVTGMSSDDRDATLENLDRQTYGIDYDTGVLYFQAMDWQRKFRVEYAYWDGSVLRNDTKVITVAANATQGDMALLHPVDQYSDRVARKFHYVSPGQFDEHNPFEFTLLNGYQQLSFSPTIAFNPIGQNRTVRTDLGPRPLTAHIDYEIVDWHVIHEDRTVPNPPTVDPNGYAIRMTLPGIKAANRRENDINAIGDNNGRVNQVVYRGLTPDMYSAGVSVVALDMTDNTLMRDNSAGGLIVDYSTGIVRIPAAVTKYTAFGTELTGQDIRGHDVRFFYQAVGDWAVQVSKGWSNYQRRDVGVNNLSSLQYDNFHAEVLQPGGTIAQIGYTNDTSDVVVVMIFPRSNAGQAIAASLIWYDVDSVPHEITGHQDKLPEFRGTRFPYMVIPIARPNRFQPSLDPNEAWKNPYFTFVQGASLKVRTIWREDPRRWESRDMETFLNRR